MNKCWRNAFRYLARNDSIIALKYLYYLSLFLSLKVFQECNIKLGGYKGKSNLAEIFPKIAVRWPCLYRIKIA